jgi:hypothetical protein
MITISLFNIGALLLAASALVVAQEPIRGVNIGGWLMLELCK